MTDQLTQAPRLLPGEPLPLRVGYTGPRSRAFLGGAVEAVMAAPGGTDGLDALVLEPDDASARGSGRRRAGRPAAGGRTRRRPVGAVRPLEFNPTTFRDAGVAGLAAVITRQGAGFEPGFQADRHCDPRRAGHGPRRAASSSRPCPPGRAASQSSPRPALGTSCAERRSTSASSTTPPSTPPPTSAGWIAKLCAAGVLVCAEEISDELEALLGAELTALLRPLRARDLADLDLRERASVALRRAALREHSGVARWRQIAAALGIEVPGRPLVSVILSTRRESWLEHGIAQVVRQSYEPRELVVCLHGDEFAQGTSQRIRELYRGKARWSGSTAI